MTPNNKARELVLKYYVNISLNCLMLDENLSKKMALIAVDEFIEYLRWTQDYHLANYWREVKQEIELL